MVVGGPLEVGEIAVECNTADVYQHPDRCVRYFKTATAGVRSNDHLEIRQMGQTGIESSSLTPQSRPKIKIKYDACVCARANEGASERSTN